MQCNKHKQESNGEICGIPVCTNCALDTIEEFRTSPYPKTREDYFYVISKDPHGKDYRDLVVMPYDKWPQKIKDQLINYILGYEVQIFRREELDEWLQK